MADKAFTELSTQNITKLKVPDLKKELKIRGLSTAGNKTELVERLQASLKATSTDTLLDEEDLLNDVDDEHLDEREELISDDLDSALDDLPKTLKRKSDGNENKNAGPPKKVILKRNTSETLAAAAKIGSEINDTGKHERVTKPEDSDDKKLVKLSEFSVKERLEMRAKKFGITNLSGDVKKLARAERFGGNDNSRSAASIKLNTPSASVDVLKQRAARFGGSVSNAMSQLEHEEKREKRKERFGESGGSLNGKPAFSGEAAKAARLERFKAAV